MSLSGRDNLIGERRKKLLLEDPSARLPLKLLHSERKIMNEEGSIYRESFHLILG